MKYRTGRSEPCGTDFACNGRRPSVVGESQGRLHRGGGNLAGQCMVCEIITGQRGGEVGVSPVESAKETSK